MLAARLATDRVDRIGRKSLPKYTFLYNQEKKKKSNKEGHGLTPSLIGTFLFLFFYTFPNSVILQENFSVVFEDSNWVLDIFQPFLTANQHYIQDTHDISLYLPIISGMPAPSGLVGMMINVVFGDPASAL